MGGMGILLMIIGAGIQIGSIVAFMLLPRDTLTVLEFVAALIFGGLIETLGVGLFVVAARRTPDDQGYDDFDSDDDSESL
jgi:purine-cytosine permease-like protein